MLFLRSWGFDTTSNPKPREPRETQWNVKFKRTVMDDHRLPIEQFHRVCFF
jgi:hypothetical protein